jgi:hypothetical protein
MVTIASARIDENGNAHGGRAGDQTGQEVCTQRFYQHKKGWDCLRFKNAKVGNDLAGFMLTICNNKHIGYDQYHRNDLFNEISKGKLPQNIDHDVSTDCSATIRSLLWLAGIKTQDFTTANEKSVLLATRQFEYIPNVSESMLRVGDILVTKSKGHTVMVVGADNKANTPNHSNLASNRFEISATYKVIASALNVRREPNTSAHKLSKSELTKNAQSHANENGALKNGTRVTCQAVQGEWVKIPSGWICGKYLERV